MNEYAKKALENAYMFFSTYPSVLKDAAMKIYAIEIEVKYTNCSAEAKIALEISLEVAKAELTCLLKEREEHAYNLIRFGTMQ